MELSDLNPDERLALVALIEATTQSDRRVSDSEEDILADVIDAVGEEPYHQAVEQADGRFANEDDLKTFLETITRQEARELIYGTLLDLEMAEVVSGHESPLLGWLAETWDVEAEVEPLEEEA